MCCNDIPSAHQPQSMQMARCGLGQSDCWFSLNQLTDERSTKVSESWKEALKFRNFCVYVCFYEFTGIAL